MTTATTGARTHTGRPPQLQRVEGALFVDLDGRRARYECYRPGCPHPKEGPVRAIDKDPSDQTGKRRIGIDGLASFIGSVKDRHLNTHHGSPR